MGGISPVLEAYLAGFQQQKGVIDTAHKIGTEKNDLELRRQQLEQTAKHFDTSTKQAQERIDLERAVHDATMNLHLVDAKDKILDQFKSGARQVPTQQVPGNSNPNMSEFKMQQVPQVSIDIPGFGPQSFNTSELGSPEQTTQRDIAKQIAVHKALSPLKIDEANQLEKLKQSGRETLLENRLTSQEEQHRLQMDLQKQLTEMRVASAQQMAEMRASQGAKDKLFSLGFNSPEDMTKSAALAVHDISTGKADLKDYRGTAYGNMVDQALQSGRVNKFPGGTQGRQQLDAAFSTGGNLLNSFDELNKAYPPAKNRIGSIADSLAVNLPVIGSNTDIGQKYGLFNSDLVNFARTKGITSTRLMDSDKEKAILKAALPSPSDSPEIREDKRYKLLDGIFTAVQGQVSALPKEQRGVIWKELLDSTPNIKKDPKLRIALEKTIEDGTYSSSYLNRGNR